MTPERWRRIDDLFHHAAAMEEGRAKREYLDQQCAGDAGLRAEIEALLQEDERSDRRIRAAIAVAAAESTPDHIGPYRVLSVLGEGGMGTVYLARRDDRQFEKQVAIKVAGAGLRFAGEAARSRFLHERQILASLEHPNIARLYDGGVTENGLPYLVMEYVSGSPVTSYCAERGLSLHDRLQLFLRICHAVEHAHRHLVVHRDLKPSNILVDEYGEPKLLDFGVAKLLEAAPSAETPPTVAGFFTPGYSSPEQLRGEPITVAADVYSLGLILFEMLTNRRAQVMTQSTPDEVERAIAQTETLRLSATASVFGRDLAGDLDNIAAMALRKDPNRRYSSVEKLSEDVRRHLEGRPVRARKDTLRYRTAKFIRRNRWPVAAAAMMAASLVAGSAAAAWQARKAHQRLIQVRHLANTFLFEVHDSLMGLPGTTAVRAKLAQTAVEYLDSLLPDTGADAALTDELAAAYEKAGDVQGLPGAPNLGHTANALASYSKAVSLRRTLGPPSLRPLALTLGKIADLESTEGRKERALGSYRDALQAAERTPANNAEGQLTRSTILSRMGATLNTMGRPFDAAGCLRSAVAHAGRRAELQPGDSAQRALALTKVRLAETLQETGDPQEALRVLLEAASALDDLARRDPASAPRRRDSMIAHLTLGHVLGSPLYLNLGRTAESEQHYRRAVALAEELANADKQNADARRNLSQAYTRLAATIRDGDPAQSVELYRKGAALTDELSRSDPANVFLLRMRAYDLTAVAHPLEKLARHSAARKALDEALKIQEAQHARNPVETEFLHDIPLTRLAMGDVEADAGSASAPLEHYGKAAALGEEIRKQYPDDLSCHAVLADVYMQIGRLHSARREFAEAAPWYRKSLGVWESWARRGVQFPSMQARVEQVQGLLTLARSRDR